jgi:hypothetical protein
MNDPDIVEDEDYFETRTPVEDPEARADRLGTETAAITIGTLADVLGAHARPMGLACRLLDAYAKEVTGECLRCGKTLRAMLCYGTDPPRRAVARDAAANWHVCDACALAEEAAAP